jgi:hypothetical protein
MLRYWPPTPMSCGRASIQSPPADRSPEAGVRTAKSCKTSSEDQALSLENIQMEAALVIDQIFRLYHIQLACTCVHNTKRTLKTTVSSAAQYERAVQTMQVALSHTRCGWGCWTIKNIATGGIFHTNTTRFNGFDREPYRHNTRMALVLSPLHLQRTARMPPGSAKVEGRRGQCTPLPRFCKLRTLSQAAPPQPQIALLWQPGIAVCNIFDQACGLFFFCNFDIPPSLSCFYRSDLEEAPRRNP